MNKHPVKVTTVHPGGIKTAIARNATAVEGMDVEALADFFDRRLASTSAEKAAQVILEGVSKKRDRVLIGNDARALDLLVRILGSKYQRLFALALPRLRPQ